MTTFKQFIHEDSDKFVAHNMQLMDIPKAIAWMKSNAMQYLNSADPIFRGIPKSITVAYSDATKLNRHSANSQNYYTLWMDNSPEWEAYPKRSKSLICSHSFEIAEGYGFATLVVPKDGTTIGVASGRDIWFSFKKELEKFMGSSSAGNLYDFTNCVFHLIKNVSGENYKRDLTYQQMCVHLKDISIAALKREDEHNRRNGMDNYTIKSAITQMEKYKWNDLYEVFETVFKPQDNGFSLYKAGEASPVSDPHREIWLSSQCVIFGVSALQNIMNRSEEDLSEDKNKLKDFMEYETNINKWLRRIS